MSFIIKDGVLEKYEGSEENIIVPDGVVAIGDGAFSQRRSIKSVTLPRGLQHIGKEAFYLCTNLERITFPEGLVSLGNYSFYDCFRLKTISLPESLKSIGEGAFYETRVIKEVVIPKNVEFIGPGALTGVEKIIVDTENKWYSSFDGILYDKTYSELISVPGYIQGTVTIHSALKKIPEDAFFSRTGVTEIILPDGIQKIEPRAFFNTGLKSIVLPDSITEIGENVFDRCSALTQVKLSNSLKKIPKEAFNKCENLISIIIPESVEEIEEYAFFCCRALSEIIIPESVKRIGKYAFTSCTGLTKAIVKNPQTVFQEKAFANCGNLADTNGLVIINNVLLYCANESPEEVIIPEGVEIIAAHAFNGSPKRMHFPDSIRQIEENELGVRLGGMISNVPHGYVQQNNKINADMAVRLIKTTSWREGLTDKDYAALQLFQTSNKILAEIKQYVEAHPNKILSEMCNLLKDKGSTGLYQKAAEFYVTYKKDIEQSIYDKLLSLSIEANAKKAVEVLTSKEPSIETKPAYERATVFKYSNIDNISDDLLNSIYSIDRKTGETNGYKKPSQKSWTVEFKGKSFKVISKAQRTLNMIWNKECSIQPYDPEYLLDLCEKNDIPPEGYVDAKTGILVYNPLYDLFLKKQNDKEFSIDTLDEKTTQKRISAFVYILLRCHDEDVVKEIVAKAVKKKNGALHKGRILTIAHMNLIDFWENAYTIVAKNESDAEITIEVRKRSINSTWFYEPDMLTSTTLFF